MKDKAMKTAVSIPNPIFEAAEQLPKRFGITRSELYARELSEYIELQREKGVTEQLNQIYCEKNQTSEIDPLIEEMQAYTVTNEEWK